MYKSKGRKKGMFIVMLANEKKRIVIGRKRKLKESNIWG